MQKYKTESLSPVEPGYGVPVRYAVVYLAEDVDALLREWLRLDDSISARLKTPHGWSDGEIYKHAAEIDQRKALREKIRASLGKGEVP